MIDYKKELEKYKPLLPMGEVEESIQSDSLKDLKDVIELLTKQLHK